MDEQRAFVVVGEWEQRWRSIDPDVSVVRFVDEFQCVAGFDNCPAIPVVVGERRVFTVVGQVGHLAVLQ
ncbi:hypothetical protein D3C79_943370 [compost metagenome]